MSYDPHATPRLRFDGTVNIPTILTGLVLLVTIAGGWNNLTNRVTKIEEAQEAGYVRGQGRDAAIRTLDVEVRALQLQATRTEEKFNAILDRLSDIQERLETAP